MQLALTSGALLVGWKDKLLQATHPSLAAIGRQLPCKSAAFNQNSCHVCGIASIAAVSFQSLGFSLHVACVFFLGSGVVVSTSLHSSGVNDVFEMLLCDASSLLWMLAFSTSGEQRHSEQCG